MADFIVRVYIKMHGQIAICHQAGLGLQLLHRADEGACQYPGKYKYDNQQKGYHCCHLHDGGVEDLHDLAAVIFHHQSPAHAAYRGRGSQAVSAIRIYIFHGGSLAVGSGLDRCHSVPVGDGFNEFLLRMNHHVALGVSQVDDFLAVIKQVGVFVQKRLQGIHVEGGGHSADDCSLLILDRHGSNDHHLVGGLGNSGIAEGVLLALLQHCLDVVTVSHVHIVAGIPGDLLAVGIADEQAGYRRRVLLGHLQDMLHAVFVHAADSLCFAEGFHEVSLVHEGLSHVTGLQPGQVYVVLVNLLQPFIIHGIHGNGGNYCHRNERQQQKAEGQFFGKIEI